MTSTDDAYLALGCMQRLVGRGHDAEVRRVAQRFIASGSKNTPELRHVLARTKGVTP
jgi:hypothetical protein